MFLFNFESSFESKKQIKGIKKSTANFIEPTRTLEQQKLVTSIIAVIIYSYRKSGRGDIVTLRTFNDDLGVTRKVFEKALNAVNALEANDLPLTNLDSLLNRKVRHDIVRLKSINFIQILFL